MSHVAVIDDEPSIREYLELLLTRAGHQVHLAANVSQFKSLLASTKIDLALSDMRIGTESGLEVLALAKQHSSAPEVILITAYGTPSAAVEAMRRGAYDYICKPFDNDELVLLVQKALEKRGLVQENAQLKATLSPRAGPFFVGNSGAMRAVYALIDKVAAAKSTVLITGESGTGKEVVSRAIHARSSRARHPFVPVNCGALNEGVLESELFGHSKGAFTGAAGERQGILVSAGEGTVLLDEVGEMPPSLQVKLLRVLQERRVKPVGASIEVPFEARILAATNRRLDKEVAAGRFREDLYFRLNVITLELPPLRERREDIVPLANYFLSRVAEDLGRPGLHFAPETLALLERYSFSGNVRQLHNLVERAATLADSDLLGPDSLPPALRGETERGDAAVAQALSPGFSLEKVLDTTERKYLLEAMKSANNVKIRAAELLGLSFRSFRYRLAKHGLGERDAE